MMRLPSLPAAGDTAGVERWVGTHLSGLFAGPATASRAFRGGQSAADAALARFNVAGYAGRRNDVWPPARRGASGLSPYIRHGLLTLVRVRNHGARGPARDVAKFGDELLWAEYARHLYARLGGATRSPLRYEVSARGDETYDAPSTATAQMACLRLVNRELADDGWLVNQTRMWFASHWTVRQGWDWRTGEDHFFRHLLDGSRAANRLGWQWTVGAATGRPYGFSRQQVLRRAPDLCASCPLAARCPIEEWPSEVSPQALADPDPRLRADPDPETTAGPEQTLRTAEPDLVWLTAESLGTDDPAARAHPALPLLFVFDEALLARLRLSGKRLTFLAECLAELGALRELHVVRGDPAAVLAEARVATTFAPVPGWRRLADDIKPVEVHPWPWLSRPDAGTVASFSAWRRRHGGSTPRRQSKQ